MHKKIGIVVFAVILITGSLFAVNPNLSVDFLRMPSRYATVNSADAAIYNPAGLPKIEDGLHLAITNQFVYKKYGSKRASSEYNYNINDSRFSALFPSANIVYKMNNWAVFANLTIPDGGGKLQYEVPANIFNPLAPQTLLATVKAESSWFGITLGGSYAINEYIAVSLGLGMLMPSQKTDITVMGNTDSTELKGFGFNGQVGVNITPIEKLNIGILYKSQAFWANVDKDTDGDPLLYAPNIIQVGIGYDIIENLNVQLGFKINLESLTPESVIGDSLMEDIKGIKYRNSMDFSLGVEYKINSFIKPSLGVAYQMNRQTDTSKTTSSNMFNPDLDAFVIGLGVVITPIKNFDITVGYMQPIYFSNELKVGGNTVMEFKKEVSVFGIGLSYKFF